MNREYCTYVKVRDWSIVNVVEIWKKTTTRKTNAIDKFSIELNVQIKIRAYTEYNLSRRKNSQNVFAYTNFNSTWK